MLFLQSHSFSIRHIPANQNKMADILSRHPVELSSDQVTADADISLSVCLVLKDVPVTVSSLISEIQICKRSSRFLLRMIGIRIPITCTSFMF